MTSLRTRFSALAAVAALALTACAGGTSQSGATATDTNASGATESAVSGNVITHAYGTTEIPEKVERIATVAWGNHEVPLALGVMPVGMAKQSWGVTDDSGMHPWTADAVKAIGGEAPVLFDETDGINFEAIEATNPDIILATYSGITKEEYETLSKIAPTIAYPTTAWGTPWRDLITINAAAINKKDEGDTLVADTEAKIAEAAAKYPQLAGKSAAFFYGSTEDLSKVGFYGTRDPRTAFLSDLGMKVPASVAAATETTEDFHIQVSAENVDTLSDVDVIVMYGSDADLAKYQADPLLGTIPAFKNGSVVFVGNGETAFSAAVGISPLSIPWVVDEYAQKIAAAADKVK